jgi:hypothetical protein
MVKAVDSGNPRGRGDAWEMKPWGQGHRSSKRGGSAPVSKDAGERLGL